MPPRRETLRTADRLRAAFGTSAFSSAAGMALGLSARQLEQAARSGSIVRIRRGLYVASSDPAHGHLGLLCDATQRLTGQGTEVAVMARSAASLWGIGYVAPHPELVASPATLAIPSTSSHRAGCRAGLQLRKIDIPPAHVTDWVGGLRVTTPLRTGIDLAHEFRKTPRHALAVMCLAMRCDIEQSLGLTDARQVSRALDTGDRVSFRVAELLHILDEANLRGGQALTAYVEQTNPALENPFEALSWASFVLSGIALPACQKWVQGASGRWYRVDFLWPALGLIGEADGAVKYGTPAEVMAERRRQADLEAAGYRFVRWIWEDVVPTPQPMIRRVERAMAECSAGKHRPTGVGSALIAPEIAKYRGL